MEALKKMMKSFPKHIVDPAVLAETKHFVVKLAENHEEVEKAQRLRYEVFNMEQGRGLEVSSKYGIDFDEFDEYCLHLIVIEKGTGAVKGTYRIHLGSIANASKGFYSSREFEIKGLYGIAEKCMELGRTCVSPECRNGLVVALLWNAISELMTRAGLIYMLGCVSLDVMDPRVGWGMYEYLKEKGAVCKDLIVAPRPGFTLKRPRAREIGKLVSDRAAIEKFIPPIFKGYLRLGAYICGEPALDGEFGTIDFFIMVDITKVPARYARHFNYKKQEL
ncbi:MAG: GNAT family N-acyltransferase [Candidatus Omnitrophota bacterium]